MRILKYPVLIEENFTLKLPNNAHILSFQIQNDEPVIWAMVQENEADEDRHFSMLLTGHDVYGVDGLRFIGTAQAKFGSFVFHLFERIVLK